MTLFAEGIRSGVLPCSYSILVVGLVLLVLRKRERVGVLGVFAGFTILSAWIAVAGVSNALAGRAVAVLLVIGGLSLALWVNRRPAGLGAAALLGTFAGANWLPCVGEELGNVLNTAQDEPAGTLLLLAVYLVGVMIPLVAVVAVLGYAPAVRRLADGRWAAWAARAALAAVGALVLTGHYDTVLSSLFRWSVL